MAKQSPTDRKVIELEERLANYKQERDALARGLTQIRTQLGVAVANGGDDLQWIAELRRELAIDQQRLPEIEAAIPVLEQQLDEARAEARKAEQAKHRRAAWDTEQRIQRAARVLQDTYSTLERSFVELETLLQEQNQEIVAAGGGVGSSVGILNRLRAVLPATLWASAPHFCEAAHLPRVPAAQRQTFADFLATSRPQHPALRADRVA